MTHLVASRQACRNGSLADLRRLRAYTLTCIASCLFLCGETALAAGTLAITTTSLPNGVVGAAYSAMLVATGGTSPYKWSVQTGTLPAGLSLNGATGAISGTPTAAGTSSLTFRVTDSGRPPRKASAALSISIQPYSVSITPKRGGLVVGQTASLVANSIDNSQVNWSCIGSGCGSFSPATSNSGQSVSYTAPGAAGVYTIVATSSTDSSKTASVSMGVSDLSGVATYHNDNSRTGANTQEYALTTANVNAATFGKRFSCAVDGAIYAQPLWVPNLTIGGVKHNVVFVATQHESLYAFDADANASPCVPLWRVSLIDSAHGGASGETSVPSCGTGALVGAGYCDIAPEVGVTGTPVIDLITGTLYVVSKSVNAPTLAFYQRLHAIDLLTGSEKFSQPVTIGGAYPVSNGGTPATFDARQELQRAGLALANGIIYVAWASHEDKMPYYGWVMSYSAATLQPITNGIINVTPNQGYGGIWMSGGAPAVDSANNLYVITGNGTFDATSASVPNNDYGDSFLQLSSDLLVTQYFTPTNQATLNANDTDFGAGGAAILVDLPVSGANPTHLVIGGGKAGYLYVLNRDSMGGYGDAYAWQSLNFGKPIFGTGALWNSMFYLAGAGGQLLSLALNSSTAKMSASYSSASNASFGFPGATPSVSSAPDYSNGIVWALDNSRYCTRQAPGCGPAVLHAYDALNLGSELWNSTQGVGNTAGYAVKFTVPTVANGKVYIGTRGNNTGTTSTIPGELDVYGLLPN